MRLRLLYFVTLLVLALPLTLPLFAQNAPVLDQGYEGAGMVSGKVTPGQAPVTIYDTTNSTHIILGTSQSVDKTGSFAAMLNTTLVVGHSLIVVDRSGASSAAMVVTKRPSSISHQ